MSRLSFAAAVLALIPAAAFAGPAVDPGEAKPAASSAVKPATFVTHAAEAPGYYAPMPAGYDYYGVKLRYQLWYDEHNCSPDGCPKPIGCGNFWTEKKFIFGSCRQFFGTAQSTVGHGYGTEVRQK